MKRLILLLVVAMGLTSVTSPVTAQRQPTGLHRLAGPSRVETAVEVSRDQFADVGAQDGARLAAQAVLLARADAFPDAIAAGPYAVAHRAPLLLTQQDNLHPATQVELSRVLAPGGRVVLLGGAAALSEAVAQQVRALGYVVERLSGPTRYATSLAIAQATTATPGQVWVADGNTFTDALLAAAAAAAHDGTIVLANGTTLDPDVRAYVDQAVEVRAVGAVAATLPMVAEQHRYAATDPAQVGAQMLQDPTLWNPATVRGVAVASSQDFPDGLTGGAHAGRLGLPLVLATSETMGAAAAVLQQWVPLQSVVLYGGEAVLGAGVEAEAQALLAGGAADLAEGVWWQFVLHRNRTFTAQGSSPDRETTTAVFTVTLGAPVMLSGQTAYPVTVTGEFDELPVPWTNLAGSVDRLMGSIDGQTLVPIHSPTAEWTGGGFFLRTDRQPTDVVRDGSWVVGAPARTVSVDASSEDCISLPGEAPICDGDEESTTDVRREWFADGVGPLGYEQTFLLSDCGGGFCTGLVSDTSIELMATNLAVGANVLLPPTWRFITPPPTPVVGAYAVAAGERIHLLGGSTDDGQHPIMQVYDPATNQWTVSSQPLPCDSHDEPKAVPHGPGLLLMTVCDGDLSAWQYDMGGDAWSELSRLSLDPDPIVWNFDTLIPLPDGALLLYGAADSPRFSFGYSVDGDAWYGGVEFNRSTVGVHPIGYQGTHMLAMIETDEGLSLEDWELAGGEVTFLAEFDDEPVTDMVSGHLGDLFVMAAGRRDADARWDVLALQGPTHEAGVLVDLPDTIIAGPAAGAVHDGELYLFRGDRAEAYRPPT